jgi:signal transduction histidine kinase
MLVTEFIDDVAAAARLAANARGISLIVRIPQDGLAIEADQHILSAVVGNLLQNALKFTRPDTTVTLTVSANEALPQTVKHVGVYVDRSGRSEAGPR